MDAASCIRFTHLLAGISNPMSPKGKSSHDNEGLPRLFHLPSPHRSLKYLLTNGDNSPHSRPVKLVLFHLPLMFRPYPLAIKTGGPRFSQASIPLLQVSTETSSILQYKSSAWIHHHVTGLWQLLHGSVKTERVHGIQLQYRHERLSNHSIANKGRYIRIKISVIHSLID